MTKRENGTCIQKQTPEVTSENALRETVKVDTTWNDGSFKAQPGKEKVEKRSCASEIINSIRYVDRHARGIRSASDASIERRQVPNDPLRSDLHSL